MKLREFPLGQIHKTMFSDKAKNLRKQYEDFTWDDCALRETTMRKEPKRGKREGAGGGKSRKEEGIENAHITDDYVD